MTMMYPIQCATARLAELPRVFMILNALEMKAMSWGDDLRNRKVRNNLGALTHGSCRLKGQILCRSDLNQNKNDLDKYNWDHLCCRPPVRLIRFKHPADSCRHATATSELVEKLARTSSKIRMARHKSSKLPIEIIEIQKSKENWSLASA